MDCGAVCLKMILEYYGKKVNLSVLKDLCNTTRIGVHANDIVSAAKNTGLNAMVFQTTSNYLQEKQPLPCILHWHQNHFVVLYKIKNGKYTIADPAHGIINLSEKDFTKAWSIDSNKGIALFLEPTAQLQEYKEYDQATSQSVSHQFKNLLLPYSKKIGLLFLIILVSTLFAFVIPKTIEYMIDKGIGGKDVGLIWKVLLFQFALFGGITLASYFQNLIQAKLSTRLGIQIISNFLYKLLNLPIAFFDTKNYSDIYQRVEDHSRIESFLSTKVVAFIFSLSLFVAYTVQLLLFDMKIMLWFLFLTVISFLWFFIFQKRRRELDYTRFNLSAEERDNLNDVIAGITEIKLNNAQSKRVKQWEKLQLKMYDLKIAGLHLSYIQSNGIETINQIKNIVITFLCAYWVVQDSITFGIMISIGYIVGQLNVPLQQIMNYFHTYQDAKISLERLNEIQLKSNENNDEKIKFPLQTEKGFKLDNVSFKYQGDYNPFVLTDICLDIPRGKTTAIVGTSGSGKTTLLKLLLAFYHPQKGTISMNDIDLKDINTDQFRDNCGVVMQDGYIYNASIAENVGLADEKVETVRVNEALKVACLYDFVQSLPHKDKTKIGSIGVELSGGQKQRLLIARAVYKNPQILFFDEATSSLDSNNEKEIMQNLSNFLKGKTVIIVAHRLSTVKNADQIIVLKDGLMIEQGTHTELVQDKKDYYSLIKNQLELGL